MSKLLKKQGLVPDTGVTDKLPSYGAALRELNLSKRHDFGGRKNNRNENSHLPVRQRERRMQRLQVDWISSTISLSSRFHLQYLLRPTPFSFPKDITSISQRNDERMASCDFGCMIRIPNQIRSTEI